MLPTLVRIELISGLIYYNSTRLLTLTTTAGSWGGDLNQIMYPFEHSSPSVNVSNGLMFQLQNCFLQAGLFDLRFLGPCHTWTNKSPDAPIAKKLDRLLVQALSHPSQQTFQADKLLHQKWLFLREIEEAFFRICQVRASFNAVRAFLSATGIWITDPIAMSHHAISHFESVLAPQCAATVVWSSPDWFAQLHDFRVSTGQVQHFFSSGFLPFAANATILSLVPKFPGASRVTEYRPFSCLNTIYKIISRLLVRRLKPILSDLILPNQTAFVKGRILVENTTLAGELINGYHKHKGSKRITIKVDIAKAFDTLSWDFLFSCLRELNQFLARLRACICTTSFMVGYNGMVNGYFKGRRGLRQGDPLSPYLFVIAINCLSHMLNKAAAQSRMGFHAKCRKIKLTHLSFADDLLIFTDGSIESVQCVLQVLRDFEYRSGLAMSNQKTSFFVSGLSEDEVNRIQVSTGMSCGTLPFRYLGVPLNSKKLSLSGCDTLLQQIKAKFSSWSVKTLSFSGRLLLIKTVISGITTFWCSAFILPKACIEKINSMCSTFLWKGDLESRNNARVAWDTVVLTKEQGGLGVKELYTWNKACALRLIWMLFFRPQSVWVCWFKEVILQGEVGNYWITKPKPSNSWLVNKLLKMKTVAYPLIRLCVQNGRTCRFWTDNWTPFGCLETYLQAENSHLGIPIKATLASLSRNGSWRIPSPRSDAQLNLMAYLTTIALVTDDDYYEWVINDKVRSRFATGEVYTYLCGDVVVERWAPLAWPSRGIPRHSFHCWLVLKDRLPTRDRLLCWGLQVQPLCLLCNAFPESRDHLYWECDMTFQLWGRVSTKCGLDPLRRWAPAIEQLFSLPPPRSARILTLLAWQVTIYLIWNERNSRLHSNTFRSVDALLLIIDRQIRNKISSFRETDPIFASALMQRWLA
ncbi:uncharacterized protein LOC125608168 [Brassica napus]|uniref:uncharacterized protein LOC125608168 n=1 Tax=Brassica napus TaxID=3708 RepID=UPI002078DCC6|nr:uncharacterized protein LOC125608168 [Brassica napus]